MTNLKIYRMHPNVELPKFGTKGSACFDLAMNDAGKQEYRGYTSFNSPIVRAAGGKIYIAPGDRVLVPTGLIFDIPEGYSVRIHPRSGLSLKQGLVLANCEGVIDSDYVEEIMIMLHNTSQNGHTVNNGDRLAQAELVKMEMYNILDTRDAPVQKTDRNGGLGSTGVSDKLESKTKSDKPVVIGRYPNGRPKYDRRKKKTIDNAS